MTWQSKTPNRHSEPTGEESHVSPSKSFRGRSLLCLALNGYTQIQIEKIFFTIMNFRFSPCLVFLPRSQSFGKGTPFQKPQSVHYPAWMTVQKFALLGLPKNLIQGTNQGLQEIFRLAQDDIFRHFVLRYGICQFDVLIIIRIDRFYVITRECKDRSNSVPSINTKQI